MTMWPLRSSTSSAVCGSSAVGPTATMRWSATNSPPLRISRRAASIVTTTSAFLTSMVLRMFAPRPALCTLQLTGRLILARLVPVWRFALQGRSDRARIARSRGARTSFAAVVLAGGQRSFPPSWQADTKRQTNDDRERDHEACANYHASCHCRCLAGRNASWPRAIVLFIHGARS